MEENVSICKKYLERMAKINLLLEMELGVTGGEEDGVDNTDVDSSRLYTQPEELPGRVCSCCSIVTTLRTTATTITSIVLELITIITVLLLLSLFDTSYVHSYLGCMSCFLLVPLTSRIHPSNCSCSRSYYTSCMNLVATSAPIATIHPFHPFHLSNCCSPGGVAGL